MEIFLKIAYKNKLQKHQNWDYCKLQELKKKYLKEHF